MNNLPGQPESVWIATTEESCFPTLEKDIEVDVLILGAGIAGLTAAMHLQSQGIDTAVIEANKIIKGVTGYTTAKISSQHDLIYSYLSKKFGKEKAFLYGKANQQAIEDIYNNIQNNNIECDFKRAPAYVYTCQQEGLDQIKKELKIALELGLPASFVKDSELPFPIKGALKFSNQAHFHPRKYLLGLTKLLSQQNCPLYENTMALDIHYGNKCIVRTSKGTIKAKNVIITTHQPFPLRGMYFSRVTQWRSYALGLLLKDDKKVMEGMYISLEKNFRSFRPQPYGIRKMLLLGGEPHITGRETDEVTCYKNLENFAKATFEIEEIAYRWATQDNFSIDHLPYIGKLTRFTPNVFIATGFGGWGMTNGTIAGKLISDQIMGKDNPYAKLYNPSRINLSASFLPFVIENFLITLEFLKGHFFLPYSRSYKDVKKCEAKIIIEKGKKIGVYREENGQLHCVSPICTHLKCVLKWNGAEKSWDCPCHGSRFDYQGKVIHGPAVKNLEKVEFP